MVDANWLWWCRCSAITLRVFHQTYFSRRLPSQCFCGHFLIALTKFRLLAHRLLTGPELTGAKKHSSFSLLLISGFLVVDIVSSFLLSFEICHVRTVLVLPSFRQFCLIYFTPRSYILPPLHCLQPAGLLVISEILSVRYILSAWSQGKFKITREMLLWPQYYPNRWNIEFAL